MLDGMRNEGLTIDGRFLKSAPTLGDAILKPVPNVAALLARIAELEDYLEELAPFSTCGHVDMTVKIQGRGQDDAEVKGWAFKRDTLFLDHRLLWKAKRLLDKREGVLPSGA